MSFPEAFLPSKALIQFLEYIQRFTFCGGSIHVGLRPEQNTETHLFNIDRLRELLKELEHLNVPPGDLQPFSTWLSRQKPSDVFNVGCLFTFDINNQLRICLHPKAIRSKFETSALQENHMAEGNLVTLVTLLPHDKKLLTVTVQPLICSDVLSLSTDMPGCRPLEVVTAEASRFGEPSLEHVDIVSVAACTPQSLHETSTENAPKLQWQQKFRESFVHAAEDDALNRHHCAAFILSNFSTFPRSVGSIVPAGLSGVFYPRPLHTEKYPSSITFSPYARRKDNVGDWRWLAESEYRSKRSEMATQGYIVALSLGENNNASIASLLGFTIHRLPRDTSAWGSTDGIVAISLAEAVETSTPGNYQFKMRAES